MSQILSSRQFFGIASCALVRRLLPLALLLSSILAHAQPAIQFQQFGVDEGLSSGYINGIAKGPNGFMWFGTAFGLNRFDGYRFISYRHAADQSNSLAHDYIRDIYVASDGRLWIATEGGLSEYRPQTDDFASHFNGVYVRQIAEDATGQLWLATDQGVYLFDPVAERVVSQYSAQEASEIGLTTNDTLAIVVDHLGLVWVGVNRGGLHRLDPSTGRIERYRANGELGAISHDSVLSLYEDADHQLWVGTANGLNRYQRDENHFSLLAPAGSSMSSAVVFAIIEDADGLLWFGSYGGLNRYSAQGGYGFAVSHDVADRNGLTDNRVRSLYIDEEGLLWVGTSSGLALHDLRSADFGLYRHRPDRADSLSDSYVWSIFRDSQERLWIGSTGGLEWFDLDRGKSLRRFVHDPADPSSLSHNTVHAIAEDRQGQIWVATDGVGLNRFDPITGGFQRFRHDPNDPASLSDDQVKSIYEDSAGTLWVGTVRGGVNRQQPDGSFVSFKPNPDDERSLPHSNVYAMAEDRAGRLWLATRDGMARYDAESNDFERFQHRPDDPESISDNTVLSLIVDRAGIFWLGTRGGLNRLDPDTGRFDHWRIADGLANDTVFALAEASDGALWLSTNAGLSRFDPSTERFENFSKADGLQSNEFNSSSAFADRDGRLYFGGPDGLNAFYPDKVRRSSAPVTLALTDVLLFNQSVGVGDDSPLVAPLTHLSTLRLGPEDSIFAFEFSALNFRQPERNRFRYRLEGFNNDWLEATARDRKAVYTRVPHGDYLFRVNAAIGAGDWSENSFALPLTIDPPWWLTWWMKTVYWLVGIGGPVAFYLIRLSAYQRRQRELEEQVAARTQQVVAQKDQIEGQAEALQSANQQLVRLDEFKQDMTGMIVHDLKNPLNAILSGLDGRLETSNRSVLRKSARQMLYLVMNILDVQKFEQAQMIPDRRPCALHDLAAGAVDQVSFLTGGRRVENRLSQSGWVLADPGIIDRVLVNFLTNAIKFTNDSGHITLQQSGDSADWIRIEIVDNGKGISAVDQEHIFERFGQAEVRDSGRTGSTGLGLSYCELAVVAHGGEIGVESAVGQGTTFWFTLARAVESGKAVDAQLRSGSGAELGVASIQLTAAEHERFMPLLAQLIDTPAYKVTALNRLLEEVDCDVGAPAQEWLAAVRDALAAADESRLAHLLSEAGRTSAVD